jgi:hypothetical protein
MNFLMNKNQSLFSHLKENYVMPFVFVKRDFIMTQEQVKNILGDLISAKKLQSPLLATFLVLALLTVTCSVLLYKKHKQVLAEDKIHYSQLGDSRLDSVRNINRSTTKSTST